MLYDNYLNKMKKRKKQLDKIYHFRFLILAVFLVMIGVASTLLGIKGNMLGKIEVPENISYGTDYNLNAKALWSSISYEYEENNSWVSGLPKKVGHYKVRAKSYRVFGIPNYSSPVWLDVSKAKMPVTILEDAIAYGDTPNLSANLYYDDYIANGDVILGDVTDDYLEASPDLDSIKVLNKDGEDLSYCYEFEGINKRLSFKPREIEITLSNKEKTYDGSILDSTDTTFSISSGSLLDGHHLEIITSGEILYQGEEKINLDAYHVYDELGNDVSKYYKIDTLEGILKILPREIKIESGSDSKEYDGLDLSNLDYEIIDGTLVEGDIISISDYVSILYAGSTDNQLEFKISNNDLDITACYKITIQTGTLLVSPKQIDVFVENEAVSKEYDGTPLENTSLSNEIDLVEGDSALATSLVSILDFGKISNRLNVSFYNEDGIDITSSYQINHFNYGTLEILKTNLKVSLEDDSKEYDGNPLKLSKYQFDRDFAANYSASFSVVENNSAILNVGSQEQNININSLRIYRDGLNITSNFNLSVGEAATAKIEKRKIQISPKDKELEFTYSGNELTYHDFSYVLGSQTLCDSDEFLLETSSYKNAGKYTLNLKLLDILSNGISKLNNYDVEILNNEISLTILKHDLNIKLQDETYSYTKDLYSLTKYQMDGFLLNESANLIFKTKYQNAGVYQYGINDISLEFIEGSISNYNIILESGNLLINKRNISVKTLSSEKIYDGIPLSNNQFEVTEGSILDDDEILFIPSKTLTNVGSIDNTGNFAGSSINNYEIIEEFGTLTVNPNQITISLEGYNTKVYDALPFSFSEDAFSDYEILMAMNVSLSPKMTDFDFINANKYENPLDGLYIYYNNDDVSDNFKITILNNYIEILKRSVELSVSDKEVIYDSYPKRMEISDLNINLCDGDYISSFIMESHTNVGEYKNQISNIIINDDPTISNYDISITSYGTLRITKRSLSIKAGSKEKIYDGIALSDNSYEVLSGTIADNDSLFVNTRGSITYYGSTVNQIESYQIIRDNLSQVDNYDIALLEGTLSIKKASLHITSSSLTREYNREVLKSSSYEATGLANGDLIELSILSEITEVGETSNIISDVKIYDNNQNDVTESYMIDLTFGTLKVTKIKLTLTSKSYNKAYDGITHQFDEVTLSKDLLSGDSIEFSNFLEFKRPINGKNTFDYSISYFNSYNDYYDVDIVYGNILISKADIIVASKDITMQYSGSLYVLSDEDYYIKEGSIFNDKIVCSINGSQLVIGESKVDISCAIYDNEEDISNICYNIKTIGSTIKVTQRILKITALSKSQNYLESQDTLTCHDYEITLGSIANGDRLVVYFSNDSTLDGPGEVKNVISKIEIFNELGIDVTGAYNYELIDGILRIY